ncbi:MAG: D-aminoacylase [Desulfobacteraceae bacterium]|nr:D-aminoacylase [Desulfobacteraceae bacterium]
MRICIFFAVFLFLCTGPADGAAAPAHFDALIKNGTIYDGTGGKPFKADVGIRADLIAAVGDLAGADAKTVVDATGLAVSPGFINMLSWATASLLVDGRSQSEIRQGVTTEVMGEGKSMGPLNELMKMRLPSEQGDMKFEVAWTGLSEYLQHLEKKGVSPNVASFLGAGTVREHVLGRENRKPSAAELERMCELVRVEMEAGALGIGSSLAYAPDMFATTEELIALCRVAARYGGMYISHIRSEGGRLIEAVSELLRISREASIRAEIYHLKAAGEKNWGKMQQAVSMIDEARRKGQPVTADMYLYTASSNRLSSRLPAWAHDGGDTALLERLRDPAARARIGEEMRKRGPMAKTLLIGFQEDRLRPLTGKTLEEVAAMRGKDQVETMLDLVLEDRTATRVVTFVMSEENIRKGLRNPWVSLGSDGTSMAAEGVFIKSATHPRAYGNFARLFGKYVREEKILSLQEAVRRVSGLPAENLRLDRRGLLKEGYFADIAIFDPEKIADRATYAQPHQYAAGMEHVLVNGVQVLKNGEHTGATPGRALWGPGKTRQN